MATGTTTTTESPTSERGGSYVRANGIDVHYVEHGSGRPLVVLHGGVVSTAAIWSGVPVAYATYMDRLAEQFRVIAPDTRGAGLTKHNGGVASSALLADDVVALIEVLGLERPLLCGFSEGALTALLVGIRRPDLVGAIVSDAGYDLLNPQAPSMAMFRQIFGGSPDAHHADPDAAERNLTAAEPMRTMFEMLKADHDAAQGEGYWRTYLSLAWDRTTRSPGYTFDDLAAVTAPTLILTGDRDEFCSVEEAVTSYRALPDGELAVLPGQGHWIGDAGIAASLEFLTRRG